jgi:hypothetical protein
MLRMPGQGHQAVGLGMQQQVAVCLIAEALDSGSVERYAGLESPGKLIRHDRYIFLLSENVTESKADEYYVLLLNILNDLFLCIIHVILL